MSLFEHELGKRKNNAMEEKQTHFCAKQTLTIVSPANTQSTPKVILKMG